jgi:YVTN family beta-propeller protein
MIYVSANAKIIYTTNVNAGTVSILEDTLVQPRFGPPPPAENGKTAQGPPPGFQLKAQHQWLQTVVNVGRGSEGFDVSPTGKELWTAAADDGNIWIIDLTTKRTIPSPLVKVIGANRLKFTADGKLVLVSSLRTGDLFIIDAKSRQLVKQLKLGKGCAGILPDPDNKTVYVACSADNYIAVIDLQKLQVINKIELAGPDGLAWATNK